MLAPDVNTTLVALMLGRRLSEDDATDATGGAGHRQDEGVTHSAAESFWSTMFLVVVLIMALCMCLAFCGIFARLLGCGSFVTRFILSSFRSLTRLCSSCNCCRSKTPTKRHTAKPVKVAKVIGPAPEIAVEDEEQAPLRPKHDVTPKVYRCCGLPLPCLSWLSVLGCSFVGCAWAETCWKRTCGCGGGGSRRQGRREVPGGGLSLVQNVLTCWRCFGLLPACCPTEYEPRRERVAAPEPTTVVRGEPVETVEMGIPIATRLMPTLNLG